MRDWSIRDGPRTTRQEYNIERFREYVDAYFDEHLPATYTAAELRNIAEAAREHAREMMEPHPSLTAEERQR